MQQRKILPLLIGLLVGHGGALGAQTSDGLSEDAFFSEMPVVLSVSRLAQPLRDAPGAVTVIDADMIRNSGARDLADLLRAVPGFLVAQSFNGAPNAVYHGITEEHPRGMQILVDGRSQYSPLFSGGVSWNTLDVALDDIARIEVIRGSNSAAYGANAFLGVVNVVTRRAADSQGVAVRVRQGVQGVQDRYARVGFVRDDLALRVSVDRVSDTGIAEHNDNRENTRGFLQGELRFSDRTDVVMQLGGLDFTIGAGVPPGAPRAGLNPIRDQRAKKFYAQMLGTHVLGAGADVTVRYTRVNESYYEEYLARDSGLSLPIDYGTRAWRDELEMQHTADPAPDVRTVWGLGYRSDAVRSLQFFDSTDRITQKIHRLFGHVEWRVGPSVVMNLGGTWEHETFSGASFSPRVFSNIAVADGHTLRVGWTTAHRVPTITEERGKEFYGKTHPVALALGLTALEIDLWASGGLKAERIDARELGYLGAVPALALSVDVRAFDERVKDRIVPVVLPLPAGSTDAFGNRYDDYFNAQDIRIRGVEYELVWRPREATRVSLAQTFIGVTSTIDRRRISSVSDANDAERHANNSAPQQASVVRVSQTLPQGVTVGLDYFRYGRYQWTRNSSVGPYHRLDWRIAIPFRKAGMSGELAFVVQGDGGRHAEHRLGVADPANPGPVAPQYLYPRSWLSLRLEI